MEALRAKSNILLTHVEMGFQRSLLHDGRYVIEVGGADKDFKQVAGLANAYIAADTIEIGSGHKIPLWLFGFLY